MKIVIFYAIFMWSGDLVSSFVTVELAPGTYVTGMQMAGFEGFLGIPFAKPPLGELRFKNPEPLPLWTGNRMARRSRLYCWQFDDELLIPISGTEDCLYLNVFRPSSSSSRDRSLNVIVFIHGGGFYCGTNDNLIYGPDFFMKTGEVILVTITYRLNVFGFLATGDAASPGNYGLKDQVMALNWVKRHIAAFGGNPEAVTLMGHSAGAASVHFHLISKQSQGLFQNAVMLSGSAISPYADPREYVNRHAQALGISNAAEMSSQQLVDLLREKSAYDLTATIKDLRTFDILPLVTYLPTVEPAGSPEAFLTVDPREAMEKGEFLDVPVFGSIVTGDGMFSVQPFIRLFSRYEEFNSRIYELLPLVLTMDPNHKNMTKIVDKVRFKYFGSDGLMSVEEYDNLILMATHYLFARPFYKTMQAMAMKNKSPVFGQIWDYKGLVSFSYIFARSPRDFGPVHADDLINLFKISILPIQLGLTGAKAQKLLMIQLMSFVKNDTTGFDKWEESKPKIAHLVNDRSNIISRRMEDADELKFWAEIDELYANGS